MSMQEIESKHGTLFRDEADGCAVRSVTIRKPMEEVQKAWSAAKLPGQARFLKAPGDRGIEVHVEVDDDDDEAKHLLSPYEGQAIASQLDEALRAFKARVETGEVPTVEGQSSGRRR